MTYFMDSITLAKPGDIAIVRSGVLDTDPDMIQAVAAGLRAAGLNPIIVDSSVEITTTSPAAEAPARFVAMHTRIDDAVRPVILDRLSGMVAPFTSADTRDFALGHLNTGGDNYFGWIPLEFEPEL